MNFTKVVLYTAADGRAKWREEPIPLAEGTPQAMLSQVFPAGGYQLRWSPVGFRSQWHCTPQPQWVFILAGEMEIGFRDRTVTLKAGELFVVPKGVEHITRSAAECHALIIEPRGVVNTGDAGGSLTARNDVWV